MHKEGRFKSFVRIEIIGPGSERFVNICTRHGIHLWNIRYKNESILMDMPLKDFWHIRDIRRTCNVKLRIIKKNGLNIFVKKHYNRYFILIGVVVFALILSIMRRYIWRIEIYGCNYYSSSEIGEYVKECGIEPGKKIKTISCENLEIELRTHFDKISWISVYLAGSSLKISIKEGNYQEDIGKSEIERDIVALKDGVITSIITRSGTPIVKMGDKVKAGDVLVMSKVESKNEYGEIIKTKYVSADADIIIQTELEFEEDCPTVFSEKIYTGNEKERICTKIGDRLVDYTPKFDEYELYDTYVFYDMVKRNDRLSMPVIYSKIIYKEYIMQQHIRTYEEKKAVLQQYFDKYIENLKENSIQIVSKSGNIEEYEGGLRLRGSITVEYAATGYAEPIKIIRDE